MSVKHRINNYEKMWDILMMCGFMRNIPGFWQIFLHPDQLPNMFHETDPADQNETDQHRSGCETLG